MPKYNSSPNRKPGPRQRPLKDPARWSLKAIERQAIQKAKELAAARGIPMSQLVEELVTAAYVEHRGHAAPSPSEPWIAKEAARMAARFDQTLEEYTALALHNQLRRDRIRLQRTLT